MLAFFKHITEPLADLPDSIANLMKELEEEGDWGYFVSIRYIEGILTRT